MTTNFILIGLYFLILLAIGWWAGRKESEGDFAIARRQVGFFRSTSSMFAVLGGVVLVGQATLAFTIGIGAIWFWVGLALGVVILGLAAPKIKPIADQHNFLTIGEYFKLNWGKANGVLSAVIIFVGFFSLLTAQFIVVGSLLGPFLDISYNTIVILTGIIVLAYLLLGGYKAVVITDVVQALLMIAILVLFASVIPYGDLLGQFNFFALDAFSILSFVVLGAVTILASADLWQRVFSAQSIKTARNAAYSAATLFLIFGFIITLVGIAAHSAFPDASPDNALFLGIFELIPEGLVGLSIVLVLAAIMSTVDTESFLLSSIIAKDFIPAARLKRDGLKKVIRLALVGVVILAILVATFVSDILLILFGLISLIITISPAIFGSLFWKLKNKAVLLSMIGGVGTLIVLFVIGKFSPDTAVLTFPAALVLLILGQLIFKKEATPAS